MLSGIDFLTYIGTVVLFAYVPGPAMVYSTAQTLARGRRSGLMAALGIHVGGYFHVILAATGLSVLLHAMPIAYLAVKLSGAGYLVWMGLKLFFKPSAGLGSPEIPTSHRSAGRAFVDSVIIDVLNPKTALFFVAFLPQFVDGSGDAPAWVQFLLLGTVSNIIFSSADFMSVLVAHELSARLQNSSAWKDLAQRIGGGALMILGVRLIVDER
jgi:threonine/homoserine/homoserine lactone efflux protein